MSKPFRLVQENIKIILALVVIGLIFCLAMLGLNAYLVNNAVASKSEILPSTSSVCGTPNPCMACVKTTYSDGSVTVEKRAKPAGTACEDECATGTCTGYNPLDDYSREPYCNATDITACKGYCQDHTDCVFPAWMEGMTSTPVATCYSQNCLLSIAFVDPPGGGTPPPTVLYAIQLDNVVRFGKEAEVCRWIIQDGTNGTNNKNCLDYGIYGYTQTFDFYACIYQHKCARPNYYGSQVPPFTIFNTQNVGIQTVSDTPSLKSSLSVPDDVAFLFKDVQNIKDISKAITKAAIYRAQNHNRTRR